MPDFSGAVNGVAFGPGTQIHVVAIKGHKYDLPGGRSYDEDLPGGGVLAANDVSGPRIIPVTFGLRGTSVADLDTVIDILVAATPRLPYAVIQLDIGDDTFAVKVLDRTVTILMDRQQRIAEADCVFKAPSPDLVS